MPSTDSYESEEEIRNDCVEKCDFISRENSQEKLENDMEMHVDEQEIENMNTVSHSNEKNKEESVLLNIEAKNEHFNIMNTFSSLEIQKPIKENDSVKKNKKNSLKWKIQNVAGGYFSDLTPIFTRDEKSILVALGPFIKVYNTKTGIGIQTIGDLGEENCLHSPKITAMALDPSNEYRIYVSDEDGSIKLWDWMDNNMLRSKQTRGRIHYIAVSPSNPFRVYAILQYDRLYPSDSYNSSASSKSLSKKKYELYSYTFPSFESNSTRIIRSQRIMKCKSCIGIVISDDGKTLAVGSNDFIYVCKKESCLENNQEIWKTHKFNTKSPISNLIMYDDHIAVGDSEGKLLIYYNILKLEEPIVRIFHWHPQTFSALNCILDGSYILTGGKEGVLVFWQVKTGNKQFLPRLGSPIKKIGISKTNSLYAILLENNSIKIISAIDLKTRCEISGVQLGKNITHRIPSIVHPETKNILFASQSLFSSTFLQSYDIVRDCQTYKTEIIRVSHLETLEKDGLIIPKPRIVHISLSMDSLWMATIDEWDSLNEYYDFHKENAEIFLKFWKWDSLSKKWNLSTRIDSPHGFGKKVTGLNASPNDRKFSTIGNDGSLKLWKLKVKNENEAIKIEIWICYRVIRYTRISHDPIRKNEVFCTTWASDSSMIIVGCNKTLLIVDEQLGIIRHTINLYMGKILFIEASGAFIIIITKKYILVWDILRAVTKWCLNIPKIHHSLKNFYLAIDHINQLFAVSFNNLKEHNSKLYIFKITSPIPIFLQQHPHKIIALNHIPSASFSFTFLDVSGHFFTLATKENTFMKDDQMQIQENDFKFSNIYGTISDKNSIKSLPEDDLWSKTVSTEALGLLFDKPAYTMPSLESLLEETMKLISEPPLERFSSTLNFRAEKA
ncbi:hypothetical protein PORY_000971 [Pneumocystis oryctolagi]|uniref:Uncharacterized protein n=1 Tax=Pneumocystis oryctolagi TaxID=42067 RepID=A0ACB7CDE6_9ASCO|nr:hypothetical protein PORY_000971 [Pneumocystis oryctolagi]